MNPKKAYAKHLAQTSLSRLLDSDLYFSKCLRFTCVSQCTLSINDILFFENLCQILLCLGGFDPNFILNEWFTILCSFAYEVGVHALKWLISILCLGSRWYILREPLAEGDLSRSWPLCLSVWLFCPPNSPRRNSRRNLCDLGRFHCPAGASASAHGWAWLGLMLLLPSRFGHLILQPQLIRRIGDLKSKENFHCHVYTRLVLGSMNLEGAK